jgi:hypothetical protein
MHKNIYIFPEQLQLFSHTKGKAHLKQPKQVLDSFIAPSKGLLKLLKFAYALLVSIYIMLHFYLENIQSLSFALRPWHTYQELLKFPFIF